MKNAFDGLICRLLRISELEDISKVSKTEKQTEKK